MKRSSKEKLPFSTLVDILHFRASSDADKMALVHLSFRPGRDGTEEVVENKMTFREFDLRARRIAANFQRLKAAGERALLLYSSGNEYITAFFGCLYAGVIPVPAYIPHSPRLYSRLNSIVANSQSKYILSTSEHIETIRLHFGKLDLDAQFDKLTWLGTDQIENMDRPDCHYKEISIDPDSVCFLQYTSGSTSDPKGVMVTHTNLIDNLRGFHEIVCEGQPADTCIVSWLPQFHDMGLISTFLLGSYSGIALVYMSPLDFIQKPVRWLQAITRYRGAFSPAPNFAYDLCSSAISADQRKQLDLSTWNVAINGAEPVRSVTLKRFVETFKDCGFRSEALNPGYGLAESTLAVTLGRRGKAPAVLHIDREALKDNRIVRTSGEDPNAIATVGCGNRFTERTQIEIIDPKTMMRCVRNRVGEIWTKSPSVAAGYWNNPEATASTFGGFIAGTNEGPFLRTGDLGFLDDGNLYISGRLKDRIIIRGKNYYPQDIERSVEESHPALRKGCNAVLLIEREGEERLIIVQELNKKFENASLGYDAVFSAMRRDVAVNFSLEIYEILLIKAGTIPKTSSGKIQRQFCKKMIEDMTLDLLNRSSIEQKPTEKIDIMTREELLELDEARRRDILARDLRVIVGGILQSAPTAIDPSLNLITLGVDSLGMASLNQTIENHYLVNVPIPAFFEQDFNLDKLTAILASHFNETNTRYLPRAVSRPDEAYEPFPLTDLQHAYWIGRNEFLNLGGIAAHAYCEYDIDAELDQPRLAHAWQKLIQRHDMLRMVVTADGYQRILKEVPPYEIEFLDLADEPRDSVEHQLTAVRDRMSHQVLPADQWPLFNIRVTKTAPNKYRIHTSIDLLIADFFSLKIINHEWFALYRSDAPALPPLGISFRDFVVALDGIKETAKYEASKAFWTAKLKNLPPAPQLPIVKDPGSLNSVVFKRRFVKLPNATWNALKARASDYSLTLSNVMLTAFSGALTTWSKSSRFTLNLTLFNRLQLHPDVDNLIGDFTSVMLLEVDNSRPRRFFELARMLQQQTAENLEHRYYNGIEVIRDLERFDGDSSRAVMPVVFTSAFTQGQLPAPEGYFFRASDYTVSQTPQVWLDHQIYEEDGELVVSWDAVDEIFPKDMLDEMFSAYVSCLNRLAEDAQAWKENMGSFIPPSTLRKREEYNRTEAPIHAELLHQPFIRQARENPGSPALLTGDKVITYGELLKASSKVGHFLRKQEIRPNELVALMIPKGWEQIVAVLGILQSGGAYLNIDPDLPEERRKYLIENAGVRVILTRADALDLAVPDDRIVYRIDDSLFDGAEIEPLDPIQTMADLAYVIYTSGSTGLPKGVMISHEGAYNTIADIIAKFHLTRSDRTYCISSLSFDLSVFDIFGALSVGAAIVLPTQNSERDADQTIRLLNKHHVTVWNSVPALLELLVENLEQHGISLSLRLIMLSGDWIPITLPDRIRKAAPGANVVSLGGATEASIWSIMYPIEHVNPAWASIPYGMPLANQKIYVLNERFEHCPDWVIGDLYIGGTGLAKGYLADQEKTDRAFVTHPVTGERLYRTADLGRFLPDGFVEFLGREDFQIKIGGYRVELGEIESTLNHHDKIRRAAVKKIVGKDGNGVLAAYFSLNGKGRLELETSGKSGDYGMEIKGNGDLLLDPMDRLRFKLSQPGLRRTGDSLIPLLSGEADIQRRYIKRGSSRRFVEGRVPLERFGNLLSCLKQIEFDGLPKYRYGSAGGLYPVQVYISVQPEKIEGLRAGVYYYDPRDHALMPLGPDSIVDPLVHVAANRSIHETSAFSIFLIGNLDAITPLYGNRAKDFCLIEAGLITQLLETSGVENEIGFCQIGGFHDASFVKEMLQLSENHLLLHALIGGPVDYDDPARSLPVAAEGKKGNPQKLIAEVRSYCTDRLPKYMIPSQWVIMEEMPLSSVGKINYKALPDPFENTEVVRQDLVKPRNELEKMIAEILQEKLGVKSVDIHENFFDMGADSMMITRAYRVLVQKTGIDFPVIRMFEYASVAALSSYLNEMKDDTTEYTEIEEKAAKKKQALERRMAIKRR